MTLPKNDLPIPFSSFPRRSAAGGATAGLFCVRPGCGGGTVRGLGLFAVGGSLFAGCCWCLLSPWDSLPTRRVLRGVCTQPKSLSEMAAWFRHCKTVVTVELGKKKQQSVKVWER